jgi:hypothetical protein
MTPLSLLKRFRYFLFLFFLTLAAVTLGEHVRNDQISPTKTVPIPSVKPVSLFDYQILYTSEGYQPDLLEIPLGSRVAFKNTTTVPMWTASDPHPTHNDYPEFDAKKDYLSDEVYIFTFTKAGTFGFHNHEKSIHRGTIRVTDPANPLPNIDKTKQSQRATRDKLLAMLEPKNPNSVFKVIDTIGASTVLARDCHDMAHDLGHRAYELYGFSAAMTFNNPNRLSHPSVDDICAGGYMHGIEEELFLHQPDLKNNPGDICSSIPVINRDSCFHGVGHSLMFVTKRDIPASLAACRSIGDLISTHRCFEGVWMEMFWGDTDHAGANSLGWTPEKPLEPCVHAQDDEKPDCFLYAHLGYLRTHPKDFTGTINLCTKSGLDEWDTRYCLRGVGITMMKHFTSHHLELTETLITGLDYGKKYAYYQGVVGYARLSSVTEGDLKNFCSILITDTDICSSVIKNNPR